MRKVGMHRVGLEHVHSGNIILAGRDSIEFKRTYTDFSQTTCSNLAV